MGAAIPQEPRRYRCLLGTVSTAANQRRAGGLRDRHLECPSRVPRVVAVCGLAVVEKDDLDTTGISAPGRQLGTRQPVTWRSRGHYKDTPMAHRDRPPVDPKTMRKASCLVAAGVEVPEVRLCWVARLKRVPFTLAPKMDGIRVRALGRGDDERGFARES